MNAQSKSLDSNHMDTLSFVSASACMILYPLQKCFFLILSNMPTTHTICLTLSLELLPGKQDSLFLLLSFLSINHNYNRNTINQDFMTLFSFH